MCCAHGNSLAIDFLFLEFESAAALSSRAMQSKSEGNWRDFRFLVFARFLFTLAVQMQAIVVGWRIYEITRDPLSLGLVGLVEAVPALSLALYGGYIVDRNKPKTVYRLVLLGSLLSGLILLGCQLYQNEMGVRYSVLALYGASFVTGLARAFSQPCTFAMVPKIIPRESLVRASAWSSSAMQLGRIIGPALGGLVFGFLGSATSYGFICVFLILAIFFISQIQTNVQPAIGPKNSSGIEVKRNLFEELMEGARYVFKHPILFPALNLDMVSVLFGGVTALLPVYAAEILHVGPKGLGALRAAPAVGAVLMGIYLTRIEFKNKAGKWLLSAVAGFGVSIGVFAISHHFFLSLVALLFSGAFDSISMVIRNSAVQLSSPDHLRGRISAVNSMFIGSSNELGELESGIAAKLLGTIPAAVFGSVMCIVTVGVTAVFSKNLRELDLEKLMATSQK